MENQPTPKRKRHVVRWIAALGAVFLLLIVVMVSALSGGTAPTATTGHDGHGLPAAPAVEPGPLTTFGNGTYLVGPEVVAGKYRSPGVQKSIAPLCYWHLADDNGTIKDQGVTPEGPSRAALTEGLTFKSSGCLDWVRDE